MDQRNVCYVAAVLDSKGDFQFGLGYTGFVPSVRIVSKDHDWLNQIKRWFPEFNGPRECKVKGRKSYYIYVSKIKNLVELLKVVADEMLLKKDQAELIKEFCESRLSHPYTPYTLGELQIVHRFRLLKGRPVSLAALRRYLRVES